MTACDHLLAAIMNGVFQGIIIAGLVALGLQCLRRTNAATRHAIWFGTLLLVAVLVPAHALRDYLSQRAISSARTEPGLLRTGEEAPARRAEAAPGAEAEVEISSTPTPAHGVVDRNFTLELARDSSIELTEPTGQAQSGQPGSEFRWLELAVNRFRNPVSWNLASSANVPRATSLVLVSICLGVALVRFVFLFRHIHRMQQLKQASAAASGALAERFRALCRKLEMNRKVELRISSAQRSPVLLGFLNPVILLPRAEVERPWPLASEQILSHELAHVRRYDDWANLVQHILRAILFFHPAVWWSSKRMVIEREFACDDWVLRQGTPPRAYALLLADLADRISRPRLLLAPGVSTTKSELRQRINMILNTRRNTSTRLATSRLGVITSAATLATALALYFAPRLVLAQEQSADGIPDTSQAADLTDEIAVQATPAVHADADSAEVQVAATPAPTPGDSGPRLKRQSPEPDLTELPALVPPIAPVPALPAVVAVQSLSPVPATPSVNEPPPEPGAAPRSARPPALRRQPAPPEARSRDASIEERLARLEELVQSLVAQRGKELERNREFMKRYNPRTEEEPARARKEQERAFSSEGDPREQAKVGLARRMKALQEQRENLERQMHELQREIEKIERDQDNIKRRYQDDKPPEKQKEEARPEK